MAKKNLQPLIDETRLARAEEYALATVAFVVTDALELSGMSQRKLAEQLGVTEARISQIINATGNPTIKSLARLAEALECKVKVEFARHAAVMANRNDTLALTAASVMYAAPMCPDNVVPIDDVTRLRLSHLNTSSPAKWTVREEPSAQLSENNAVSA